ncbi:MAG: PEGA domain-containing protein [Myxococcales bacterium]|nr:PEGA domain-containing protein [Myxococcales bacterium]
MTRARPRASLRRRHRLALAFGLGAALGLGALAAPGIASADDPKAQAKEYYAFGARAFEAGQFRAAAKAFDAAYRLVPRSALLFSAGQALRRQYALDHQPDDLKNAIDYYRRYTGETGELPRRGEAAAALAELEPMAQRLGLAGGAAPADPKAPPPVAPGPVPGTSALGVIMVSSSVKGAKATLDGKPVEMPLSAEVPPGKHVIKLSAAGYFDLEREVQIAAGASFATDLQLKQKPARLAIETESHAEITLDGRPLGTTPLAAPLEVSPGTRRLVVSDTGHHPYVADLDFKPDATTEVPVELESTVQRDASIGLFVVAGAGAVAGGVLAGVAMYNQNRATRIDTARESGNITDDDRRAYDAALVRRDDYRRWSAVAFTGAGVVGVTGLFLFLIDSPEVTEPPRKDEGPADEPSETPADEPLEMGLAPAAPGAEVGASLSLRF